MTTTTGVFVQTTEPYQNLFFEHADRWSRADGRVYVYDDSTGQDGDPVAEVAGEHFVSACQATAESLADHDTADDDSEVSP
jgi:hypothetical protein